MKQKMLPGQLKAFRERRQACIDADRRSVEAAERRAQASKAMTEAERQARSERLARDIERDF